MAPNSYALLSTIPDPNTRAAVKLLMDRLGTLEAQVASIGTVSQSLTTSLDFANNRGINLGAPQSGTDAVPLDYMQQYVGAAIKAAVP